VGAGAFLTHNAYNELWPLEDGGVLYILPAFVHHPDMYDVTTIADRDSLVKVDGITGKILWKVCLTPSNAPDLNLNPWVHTMTTSPNGDLYIGGMVFNTCLYQPAFIYKVSDVGHIYDPIPQASPTATKPQWQERKVRLAIYPNPAKRGEAFSYSLPADRVGGLLEIFSADGRKVYSQTITQSSGSVSIPAHLNAGVYLVRAGGLEAKWIIE